MKYLVTGGAGFIGSHLCEELLADGHEVVCLDNFNDYYEPDYKRRNIAGFKDDDNFELVEHDIREELEGDFSDVDALIHIAARAGVRPSIEEPFLYYEVNVNGTINMLELAVSNDIDKFVFGSSSSVYGISDKIPFKETDPGMPISPYAASKMTDEYICRAYADQYGMDVACLRFFTVYGPRNRPDMAVHLFTNLISSGEPIRMFGDGTSKRDYTYVKDIVSGIIAAAEKQEGFDIYNLGNNRTVELKELISTVEEAVGKKAKINQEPMKPGDVPLTYADISKAQSKLGYDPKTDIKEGIGKFVDWYKEAYE